MRYVFGEFTVDDGLFEIRDAGGPVAVERRVFDLLLYLITNSDRVVTKAEIFRAVWPDRVVSDASLSVAVAAIRRALRDDSRVPRFISTHHGRGYRFLAKVEKSGPEEESPNHPALSQSCFVGRVAELETLRTLLNSSRADGLRIVTVDGEAGIGKTRLFEAFAQLASMAGWRPLTSRCPEEPGAPAFWPWIQILRQCVGDAPSDATPLEDRNISALVPELGKQPRTGVTAAQNSGVARFQLFESIADVVTEVAARQPVALFLDDLHRADEASVSLLAHFISQRPAARVILILSHRVPNRSEAVARTMAVISRHPNHTSFHLSGLSPRDAELLIQATATHRPSSDVCIQLHQRASGNPLFLTHLARTLDRPNTSAGPDALPTDIASVLLQEIPSLSPEASELISVASVAGSEFSLALLALTMTRSASELLPALEECEQALLIDHGNTPHRFRFRHDLLRQALYEQASTARRAVVHAQVARAYLKLRPDPAGPELPFLAHHLFEAAAVGAVDDAIDYAQRAAEWSSSCFAHEDAATQYQRALELLDLKGTGDDKVRCALLLKAGTELTRAGARERARQAFESAARIATRTGSAGSLADAALSVAPGVLALESGVTDSFLIELLETAMHALGEEHPATRAKLLGSLSLALHWAGDLSLVQKLAREAHDVAQKATDRSAEVRALQALWSASHGPAFARQRRELSNALTVSTAPSIEPEASLVSQLFRLYCLLEAGDLVSFDTEVGGFQTLAQTLRQPQALWYGEMLSAMRFLLRGDFAAAGKSVERFATLGRQANDANSIHSAMAHAALLAFEQGDVAQLLPTAHAMAQTYPSVHVWRAAECWMLAVSGAREAALSAARGIPLHSADEPSRMDWNGTLALLGETATLTRDEWLATKVEELLSPMTGNQVLLGLCTICWGSSDRILGMLADCLGKRDRAVELLERAIAADDRSGARPWAARGRVALARIRTTQASRSSKRIAAQLLKAATTTAKQLRMTNLLRDIERLNT